MLVFLLFRVEACHGIVCHPQSFRLPVACGRDIFGASFVPAASLNTRRHSAMNHTKRVRQIMKRIRPILIALSMAFPSCSHKEQGIYLDHDHNQVRLDGVMISRERFDSLMSDKNNAGVKVTVIKDTKVDHTTLGELDSAIGVLIEESLSSKAPEYPATHVGPSDRLDPFPLPDGSQNRTPSEHFAPPAGDKPPK
jgi:hypothetical protein